MLNLNFGYWRITQTHLRIVSNGEILNGEFIHDIWKEFTLTGKEYDFLKGDMQAHIDTMNYKLRVLMINAVPDMDPNWDNDRMHHRIWCISGQTESADPPIFGEISKLWEKLLNMTYKLYKFIPTRSLYWCKKWIWIHFLV